MGSPVFVAFMDASKAFDRLNHSKLFHKLYQRGVPTYLINIIALWYSSQRLFVKWGNNMSEGFTVSNGVRQGGILSPLLFNVYMNDLSSELNNLYVGCRVGGTMVNHLMYADELVLIAPTCSALRQLVTKCTLYSSEFDIVFNAQKTVCMLFQSKLFVIDSCPSIMLDNITLSFVKEYKYLGHIIVDNLKDDSDIQNQMKFLYARGNTLIRKFSYCSFHVKIMLFNSYCSPVYCCALWSESRKQSFSQIRVAYNRIFRMFLGFPPMCSASEMFVNCNVKSFNMIIRTHVNSLKSRIDKSENSLIKAYLNSDVKALSTCYKHWVRLLYLVYRE